ncbi:MAG: septal ring lytic transglycosylase RlpA family protein [Bacteroidota bacterium]
MTTHAHTPYTLSSLIPSTLFRLLALAAFMLLLNSCGVVSPFTERTAPEKRESLAERFSPGEVIQRGSSSWYGPNFQGKITANGEVYNMDDLTAAHRTLPFNTVVRVTNQVNGRSVEVRINDRGPYVGDRIIDISRRAAEEIDMIQAGVQEVELQLVEIGDREVNRQNSSSQENFTVQIGSFEDLDQAIAESEKVDGSEVVTVTVNRNPVHRIYFGEYVEPEDAERQLQWLRERGHTGFVKQREN